MFDLFRSRTTSVRYLLMVLLSLVALSMVVTLIPGFGSPSMTSNEEVVAEIGGEAITTRDLSQVIQQQIRGNNMSPALVETMLPQIMSQMVGEYATAYQARKMGFTVSDAEVVQEIKTLMPQLFQGGEFVGKEAYQSYLSQMNLSIAEFEAKIRQQVLLDKLQRLAFDGIIVTPKEVEAEYQKKAEQARLEVVSVDAAGLRESIKPTREEMLDHLKRNQAGYQVPPTRNLVLVVADADRMGSTLQISDDELRAAYNGQQDRFRTPERVNVRHILVKAESSASAEEKAKAKAKAEDLIKQIKGGANFAELAKKHSEDPGSGQKGGDLDWITRGQTVKPFEDAAFSLKPNEMSGAVESLFGYHIIQPLKKEAARVKPFEEVREELLSEMRRRMLFDKMPDVIRQAREETVKDPAQAAAIAAKHGLAVERVEKFKPSDAFPMFGDSRDLAIHVAGLDKGGVSEVVQKENQLAYAVVLEVLPGRPAELSDVETMVRAAVVEEKARAIADGRVQKIQATLTASPDDIQKAAAAIGAKVIDTGLFARGSEMKGVGPQAYFGENPYINPVGKVIGPHSVGPARYFYKIVERAPGPAGKLDGERSAIVSTIKERKLRERRELFEDGLIQQLKGAGVVKVNEDLLKRIGAQYRSSGA